MDAEMTGIVTCKFELRLFCAVADVNSCCLLYPISGGDPYQKQITECVALVSAEVSKQLASDETRPPTISAELGLKLAGEFSRSFAALPRKDTVLALAQRKFQSVPTSSMDGRSSSAASAPHTPEGTTLCCAFDSLAKYAVLATLTRRASFVPCHKVALPVIFTSRTSIF
jgi:hypothetical protein